MAASPSPADLRPPDPPDSPRTRKKSFANVVSGSVSANQPVIPLKRPQTYRGKPAIGISRSEISVLASEYKYGLIGKFSHGRPSMEVVRQRIASFGLKGTYTVGSIDAKHLVVNLRIEEDYTRLLLKSTWYVDSYPMRIFKWTPRFHPSRETPIAPVWITLPCLPLYLFNKNMLYSIANLIGKPLKIDEPTANVSRPSVARVCVEVDLSRPLVESVWISETLDEAPDNITSQGFWQEIIYDYLPAYCNYCYHVGHDATRCLHKDQSGQIPGGDPLSNKPLEKTEMARNKGKAVMEQDKIHNRPACDQGFMKDARKGGKMYVPKKGQNPVAKEGSVNIGEPSEKEITREAIVFNPPPSDKQQDLRVLLDAKRKRQEDIAEGKKSDEMIDGAGMEPTAETQAAELKIDKVQNSSIDLQINDAAEKLSVEHISGKGSLEQPKRQEDLIHLDDEPMEEQLINHSRHHKRSFVGDKTIEAMMAELIPIAQLQAVCGVQKDSAVVTEQRMTLEGPLMPASEILIFKDQDDQLKFEDNVCVEENQDELKYDLEDEPLTLDRHGEYSRDDLSLLGDINTGIGMKELSVHPHTHSRRKSAGDEVVGVDALMENDDPQRVDNLRRSTRIKKPTFKVRKSPFR